MPREITAAYSAYTLATLTHFTHNAALLHRYPNLPQSLTPTVILGAATVLVLLGAIAFGLSLTRFRRFGYVLLACYAGFGFDGLAHYAVARPSAHTLTMNATIWAESLAACLLIAALLRARGLTGSPDATI